MPALLEVSGLRTVMDRGGEEVPVIDGVDLAVAAGETLAIVGESGSGKSVTALSIMRLVPDPPMRIAAGSVKLQGRELLPLTEERMCRVRGGDIGMIFQEPMASLNPVMTIGAQIGESLRLHRNAGRAAARDGAIELLARVRIPDPARRVDEHPHRLSGGMRQRVMLAIALAGAPRLLIADEPTTALDVTVEAQIMTLLRSLQRELDLGILLITHNVGLVARWAQRVAIMYAGRIVESGTVGEVLAAPAHPYTRALLAARPGAGRERLEDIRGVVPALGTRTPGCAFAPRCRFAIDRCRVDSPTLTAIAPERHVACHRAGDIG